MTQVDELEIKLYQLLKEDNWSDESATQAVNAVKGLQKEANKDLVTKVDLADTKADLSTTISDAKVSLIKWMVATALTAVGLISGIVFAIVKLVQ